MKYSEEERMSVFVKNGTILFPRLKSLSYLHSVGIVSRYDIILAVVVVRMEGEGGGLSSAVGQTDRYLVVFQDYLR